MAVSKPLRYLVLLFNFIFVVFGIILLGIGIWGEVNHNEYGNIEFVKEQDVASGPRLLIAIAVIIIVISFLGCCGAWKENKCMLCTFVILLSILLILEIAAAALAYKHKDEFKSKLEEAMKKKIKDYKPGNDKDIDDLQKKLDCCGVNSYKDWNNTNFNNNNNKTKLENVPDSCCKTVTKGCGEGKLKSGDGIYTEGCLPKLYDQFHSVFSATGGISIAILVVQILGIILGLVLFCQVRSNQDMKEIR